MSVKFGIINPFKKWKKGDLPRDPTVSLILKEGYFSNTDGDICVSATLASDYEIDYAVDQLQKNLESVRKEAKRVLKTQRDKIRTSFDNARKPVGAEAILTHGARIH